MKKGKLLLIILFGLVLCAMLMMSGCRRKQSPTTEPNKTADSKVSVVELGDVRIQLLSDTIVRIENKGPKGFEDRPSYIVTNREDYDKISYTLEKSNGITISFAFLTVLRQRIPTLRI